MTHWGTDPIVKFITNLRHLGLEYTSRRFYGLYGGEVTDYNALSKKGPEADPADQAMVRIKVGVLGIGTTSPDGSFDPKPMSRTALPASIYAGKDHGIYFPPEVGDPVWVSFDHGDSKFPRSHGSWWRNTDPNKNPAMSEVPAEFRLGVNGKETKGPPKRRGIKSKYGHGLIFSDEESAPYVALWSGKHVQDFTAAHVNHQITLSDATGVPTSKDETVDAGIYANTIEGLRVELDDTAKSVLVSGNPTVTGGDISNSIKIEDLPGKITIKTKGAEALRHEVVLDNTANKITIQTKQGPLHRITLDANTGNIDIISPAAVNVIATGAITLAATGGIAMGSGAAPPAPGVPGASVESGIGTKLVNYVGIVTENLGGLVQTVVGAVTQSASVITQTATTILTQTGTVLLAQSGLNITQTGGLSITLTAPTITLLGGLITIGNPVTAQQVSNATLLGWLKTHTHPTAATGPPSVAIQAPLLDDPSNPALPNPLYVTQTKMA